MDKGIRFLQIIFPKIAYSAYLSLHFAKGIMLRNMKSYLKDQMGNLQSEL